MHWICMSLSNVNSGGAALKWTYKRLLRLLPRCSYSQSQLGIILTAVACAKIPGDEENTRHVQRRQGCMFGAGLSHVGWGSLHELDPGFSLFLRCH